MTNAIWRFGALCQNTQPLQLSPAGNMLNGCISTAPQADRGEARRVRAKCHAKPCSFVAARTNDPAWTTRPKPKTFGFRISFGQAHEWASLVLFCSRISVFGLLTD